MSRQLTKAGSDYEIEDEEAEHAKRIKLDWRRALPKQAKLAAENLRTQVTGLQRTLNGLAGVNLSVIEARQALPCIQDHKWYVSEQLGGDIGWRVAAIDYFENIYQSRGEFSKTRALKEKLGRWAKHLGGLYLTHQEWKVQAGGQ